jgi:transcriptional regulator with XRE-family HTH domain
MFVPEEDSKRYQKFLKDLSDHFDIKESEQVVESVGERIKKARKEKGISIEDLSARTGFSVEMLSNFENQKASPQIGTIIRLAKALKTVFGTLTSDQEDKNYSVVRQSERKVISRHASQKGHNYSYMSLASDVNKRHMETFIVKLEPQDSFEELSIHDGEEFIFVIEGEVKLRIEDKTEILSAGDSIYYFSNIPHLVSSNISEPTYILAVIYTGS